MFLVNGGIYTAASPPPAEERAVPTQAPAAAMFSAVSVSGSPESRN